MKCLHAALLSLLLSVRLRKRAALLQPAGHCLLAGRPMVLDSPADSAHKMMLVRRHKMTGRNKVLNSQL